MRAFRSAVARRAREVEVALPQELARETQIRLVQDYVDRNFVQAGLGVGASRGLIGPGDDWHVVGGVRCYRLRC
nr:MobA/MobL family protein [Secundilactobacillus kimchicus]